MLRMGTPVWCSGNLLLTIMVIEMITIENGVLSSQFKLSDLPVLKKWEVPKERFAKHVGRRYKDLDNLDKKRSAYWELKPDFTANEMDWDENPAKLQLDYNYKNFFEDDEPAMATDVIKQKEIKAEKRSSTGNQNISPLKKATLQKRLTKTRSRRSMDNTKENDNRSRRDTLTDILNRAQMNALQKLDRIDSKLKKLSSVKKDTIPAAVVHKEIRDTSKVNNMSPKSVLPSPVKKSIVATPSITAKRNEAPKTTKKSGVLGDEPGVQMKRSRINDSLKSNHEETKSETHIVNPKTQIEHPTKEQSNIDLVPSNVARAVAMAMEQLKRDKMWGKVFVHVRPSGQLKVMVQETKRMEE